jgi:hypothetical protein
MEPQQADQQSRQLAFDFAGNSAGGFSLWREQHQASVRRLGAALGYPLGENCEIELRSGLILRGMLFLDGEDLLLSAERGSAVLRVGQVNFSVGEIASCVRID